MISKVDRIYYLTCPRENHETSKQRRKHDPYMGVRNSPIDTVPEEAEIEIFLDKDIKSDVMLVLKQLNETILQELKSKA